MAHSDDHNDYQFATRAIHAGFNPAEHRGHPAVLPITLATTFEHSTPGVFTYFYSRMNNPTREALEKLIASLENGKYCVTFGSGMGAVDAFYHYVNAGEHVICMDDVYGGTSAHFRKLGPKHNITTSFVDMTNLDNLKAALQPNTKLIWIESVSNPCMKLVDIKAASAIIKEYNKDIVFVVDNTFPSPYYMTPLDLGADVTVESMSKYMNGHSDVIMGCMSTNNKAIFDEIHFIRETAGLCPAPHDCYMAWRGLKTMSVRMPVHLENGLRVARFLEGHPMVEKVLHPLLESHPQRELALKQMRGYGSTFSVELRGGLPASRAFLTSCKLFMCAVSLGGYESLMDHPALMTHASVPPEKRAELGISDGFVRIAVGIEDADDLIADLKQALDAGAAAMEKK